MINDLDFATLLPDAPFSERHSRRIPAPIDRVWESLAATTGTEIRLLEPLFRLRGLPAVLTGNEPPAPVGARPALELFAAEGFVMLRQDDRPREGRAILIFGAAGKFWSLAHNKPRRFRDAAEFMAFNEPGFAKTVARFELFAEGDATVVVTETLVAGTDAASTRKFRPYWMIIRGPSGLIRRSWLAAINRRSVSPLSS